MSSPSTPAAPVTPAASATPALQVTPEDGDRPPSDTLPEPRRASRLAVLLDRRGLTAAGAALAAAAVATCGGAYDVVTGSGLRLGSAIGFVVGIVVAALLVHREDLRAVAVLPPLLFAVLLLAGSLADRVGADGSLLGAVPVDLVNALIVGAPALVAGTGAAWLLCALRGVAGRRR